MEPTSLVICWRVRGVSTNKWHSSVSLRFTRFFSSGSQEFTIQMILLDPGYPVAEQYSPAPTSLCAPWCSQTPLRAPWRSQTLLTSLVRSSESNVHMISLTCGTPVAVQVRFSSVFSLIVFSLTEEVSCRVELRSEGNAPLECESIPIIS